MESCVHYFSVHVDNEAPEIRFDTLTTDEPNLIAGRRLQITGEVFDADQPLPNVLTTFTVYRGNEEVSSTMQRTDPEGKFDQFVTVFSDSATEAIVEVCVSDVAANESCKRLEIAKQVPCIDIETPVVNAKYANPRIQVSGTVCPGVNRIEFSVGYDG